MPQSSIQGYPKTLVIGAGGYLGKAFHDALRREGARVWGATRRATDASLMHFDLREPAVGPLGLEQNGIEAVIIGAGISGVTCEKQPRESWAINVDCTLAVLEQLLARHIVPVFFSSDQVFDGARTVGGYADDDPPKPKTEYGRQKVAVERYLQDCGKPYLVARMSKVFGLAKGDGTLLDEMARSLAAGEVIREAHDQVFCPTRLDDVVQNVLGLLRSGIRGVVNVCLPEIWSRYDLGVAMARRLDCDESLVRRVSIHAIFPDIGRPEWTAMTCRRLAMETQAWFTPMATCIDVVANHYGRVTGG